MEVREDDETFKNPVDLMFDALEAEKPDHFAVANITNTSWPPAKQLSRF